MLKSSLIMPVNSVVAGRRAISLVSSPLVVQQAVYVSLFSYIEHPIFGPDPNVLSFVRLFAIVETSNPHVAVAVDIDALTVRSVCS